jgi:hypothetical protein
MADKIKKPTEEEMAATMQRMQQRDMQQAQLDAEAMQAQAELDEVKRAMTEREKLNAHNADHTQYGAEGSPKIIGREEVAKADEILRKYKQGKANLEKKIVSNEQWYKGRHWEEFKDESELKKNVKAATSQWLFNSLVNKHADIMDNYPEATVLPRAADDEATSKILTSILPVVLEQNKFEQTFNDEAWYKLKQGTGVYGIFWNSNKNNGLGDIEIKKMDILNMFWESGITDIQDSENLFVVQLISNKRLKQAYPDLEIVNKSYPSIDVSKYIYDDTVDTTDMSAVVDWYYKIDVPSQNALETNTTRTIVHYCKYVNGTVLYASENDERYRDTGYYDHGLYPFVFDTLFPEEGTPVGFGFIDIMKNAQEYIDRLDDAILNSALVNSKPRYFVREDGGINEEELLDTDKPLVRVSGNLGEDAIRPMTQTNLNGLYVTVLENKINELKETSGNRDVNQGSTSSGVTAASAIAALQEAGSKGSRDINKGTYRAFTEICNIVIELMRQFYDEPRMFRITGNTSNDIQFQSFDNSQLKPQAQGTEFGIDLGSRLPIFDLSVAPAKKSAYSKMSNNELALQFYNLGFFAPNNADQTLACLNMMEFENKDKIIERVQQNQTLFDMVQQLQAQIVQMAAMINPQMAQGAANMAQNTDEGVNNIQTNSKAIDIDKSEGSQADKMRYQAQNAATPS